MSLRYLDVGLIVATVLTLTVAGCSSPPWRKKHDVTLQEKYTYLEQATDRTQYDTSRDQSHEYPAQPAAESIYPSPVSNQTAGKFGGCCH